MFAGAMSADKALSCNFKTAYYPIAAFTQYGPHLPLTAGIIITGALAEQIGTKIHAFTLPTAPFGTCREQTGYKYGAGINSRLLYEMTLDLAKELKRQGFTRLVLHQGYFGLDILYPLTRHINAVEGIQTVLVNPLALVAKPGSLHADEVQTSLMMYIDKTLVREERLRDSDHVPDAPYEALNYKSISAYCPNGVWGRPSRATYEEGERVFHKCVELSVNYINEAFGFMEKNGGYEGGI